MTAPKCPFQSPIISEDFACQNGQAVSVRNTPQIHCRSPAALENCRRLHAHLKAVGLPAFDMQDDLTTTPNSVYLKIQYGGLLGLQEFAGLSPARPGSVDDVHSLVDTVTAQGEKTDALPYPDLVPFMLAQKLKRRRGG